MGLMDNIKGKLKGQAGEHGDQVSQGVDKAGDFADEKTGGKHADQVDKGQDFAKDQLDGESTGQDNVGQ